MPRFRTGVLGTVAVVLILLTGLPELRAAENSLPPLGRDAVLVWKIRNAQSEASFVARIAVFAPDRYLEWEDGNSQGTVWMSQRDVLNAKGYETSSLFVRGMDKKSRGATTLWLSRRIFLELMEKKRAKCRLDGVPAILTYLGEESIPVEVNRAVQALPAIKIADDRGAEWCFLNSVDNALMLRYRIRTYSQTLSAVSTNRANTLRWIKGPKLKNPAD